MNYLARFLVLLVLSAAPFHVAHAAASLEVSPIRITLNQNATIAAMTIHNRGTTDALVQLRVAKWSQQDGKDLYEDSDDMIACPPLFNVAAGEEQVVRMALGIQHDDWSQEGSYRLYIQEVPARPDDGAENQVQFAVRISIPIFLQPETKAQPPLSWKITQDNGLWATVENSGNAHALVSGIRLMKDGEVFFDTNTHQYILPGSTMTWRLDSAAPFTTKLPDGFDVMAATDQGVYQETLPAEK